jgi:hypothetical protein
MPVTPVDRVDGLGPECSNDGPTELEDLQIENETPEEDNIGEDGRSQGPASRLSLRFTEVTDPPPL